jgi:serine protease Do
MKKLFIPAIFFTCFQLQDVVAQNKNEETIVIKENDNGKKKITVEIKDGVVYIDGKRVATNERGRTLKIIKEFGKGLTDNNTDIEINIPNVDGNAFGGMQIPKSFMMPDQGSNGNKAMLGVVTQPTQANSGALINEVTPGSAAELAGLKSGDIIYKVDGKVITNPEDLVNAISSYEGGDKVAIEYERNGKEQVSDVVLLAKPNHEMGLMNGDDFFKGFEDIFKGFKGFNMDNGNFRSFNFGMPNQSEQPKIGLQVEDRADGDGVRVTEILKDEVADKAGIKVDDVITGCNNRPISNIDDLSSALSNANSEVNLTIKRAGKAQNIKFKKPTVLKKKDF